MAGLTARAPRRGAIPFPGEKVLRKRSDRSGSGMRAETCQNGIVFRHSLR